MHVRVWQVTTEEALAELELEVPWTKKLSCPKHSDSDPSLHIYDGDKGWYCFSCLQGGDGWDLLSLYLDGHSYESIAERLECDTKTVDNALQRVKRKVGVHLSSREVLL